MVDYKMMNQKDLKRLSDVGKQVLNETDQSMRAINDLINDYKSLIQSLEDLPKRLNEEIMVPLGRVAYMPGRLVDTERVTMLLGDSWFTDTTTDHARSVARRRMKILEVKLEKWKEQSKLIESKHDYANKFIKEKEECVEILEECTEEEYQKSQDLHWERTKAARAKEKESEIQQFDVDSFFKKYKDDDEEEVEEEKDEEEEEDDDDDVDATTEAEDFKLHAGFKSILTEMGIDCTGVESEVDDDDPEECDFSETFQKVINENNKEGGGGGGGGEGASTGAPETSSNGNQMECTEESRDGGGDGDDDEPSSDLQESNEIKDFNKKKNEEEEEDNGICTEGRNKIDKSLEMDEGFKLLVTKLGLHQEDGEGAQLPPAGPSDERVESPTDEGEKSEVITSFDGTNEKFADDQKGRFDRPKKSVSWKDELVVDGNKKYSDGNGKRGQDEDEDDENKPATIVVHFKHSDVSPSSSKFHPPTDRNPDEPIMSPADIYTKMYKPQSILKSPRQINLTPHRSETEVTAKSVQTAPLSEAIRPAVSAKVVERTIDPTESPWTAPLPPAADSRDEPRGATRVSKFKMDMARKNKKLS